MFARSPDTGPLQQSEILSGVIQTRISMESLRLGDERPQVEEIQHPYSIVLTQDCDLYWDFTAREQGNDAGLQMKLVPNVLLCELSEEAVLRGEQGINSEVWRRIAKNLNERFHRFPEVPPDGDRRGDGLPSLVADFKRIFTVPTEELYARMGADVIRRSFLQNPHLQHFSSRFGYYCLRVALPDMQG